MTFRLKENIAIKKIDNESLKYSLEVSNSLLDENLYHEDDLIVNNYGLLFPPILVFDSGLYVTVSGKRIIAAYRRINKDLPFGLIIDKPRDEYSFLKYLINMKRECTGLNIIEKSIALKKCLYLRKKSEEEILALLEIPKKNNIIEKYLTLDDASDKIKTMILMGKLHEYTAFEIFNFLKDEWDLLADFITGIFTGTKKRNKILNMIFEISQRDGRDARSVIESDEIKDILNLPADPPHIGEKMFEHIEKLRYPVIWKYRKRFYEQLKDVDFDKSVQFVVPGDFEHREYSLSFPFSSIEDFNKQVKKLEKIGAGSPFKKLMRIE
jgi:hypothetical protein